MLNKLTLVSNLPRCQFIKTHSSMAFAWIRHRKRLPFHKGQHNVIVTLLDLKGWASMNESSFSEVLRNKTDMLN